MPIMWQKVSPEDGYSDEYSGNFFSGLNLTKVRFAASTGSGTSVTNPGGVL
jgi:hypothetical protein